MHSLQVSQMLPMIYVQNMLTPTENFNSTIVYIDTTQYILSDVTPTSIHHLCTIILITFMVGWIRCIFSSSVLINPWNEHESLFGTQTNCVQNHHFKIIFWRILCHLYFCHQQIKPEWCSWYSTFWQKQNLTPLQCKRVCVWSKCLPLISEKLSWKCPGQGHVLKS